VVLIVKADLKFCAATNALLSIENNLIELVQSHLALPQITWYAFTVSQKTSNLGVLKLVRKLIPGIKISILVQWQCYWWMWFEVDRFEGWQTYIYQEMPQVQKNSEHFELIIK